MLEFCFFGISQLIGASLRGGPLQVDFYALHNLLIFFLRIDYILHKKAAVKKSALEPLHQFTKNPPVSTVHSFPLAQFEK